MAEPATNGTLDNGYVLELAALITQSAQAVMTEYAAASRTVPSLDNTDASKTVINPPILEAVRVLESACAQLCATVAPAEHIMVNVRPAICTARLLTHTRRSVPSRCAAHVPGRAGLTGSPR